MAADGKLLHRLTLPGEGRSMWFDRDGTFSPILPEVAELPMPFEDLRVELNREGYWVSSVDDLSLMDYWFPDGLLDKLKSIGFVERSYLAKDWVEKGKEVVFRLDTAKEVTA